MLDDRKPKMGTWTNPIFETNQALVVSSHPVKFQVDRIKRLQVRVWKPKYFGQATLISKATKPWWCHITLLSFKLIRQSIFELETGN